MARFKETNKRQGQFIPVIFEEQILPGTIELIGFFPKSITQEALAPANTLTH